jgi:hypothetical protein
VKGTSRAGLVAIVVIAAAAAPVAAQDAPLVGEVAYDSVALADVFDLRVHIPVPPGTILYFPDTLPASDELESIAPVEWREASGENGGATVTLTYRLIAFGIGSVPIPEFAAVLAPVGPDGPPEGAAVTEIAGGSFVGAWDDGVRRYGGGARRLTVASPRMRVTTVVRDVTLGAGAPRGGPA